MESCWIFVMWWGLSACQQAVSARVDEDNFSNKGPKSLCEGCFHSGRMVFDETLYPINYYSKFISDKEIENIDKIVNKSSFEEMKTFRWWHKYWEHALLVIKILFS